MSIATLIEALGALLVVIGVAVTSVPFALILAGALLIYAANFGLRSEVESAKKNQEVRL